MIGRSWFIQTQSIEVAIVIYLQKICTVIVFSVKSMLVLHVLSYCVHLVSIQRWADIISLPKDFRLAFYISVAYTLPYNMGEPIAFEKEDLA